ncbi:class F sortase [Mumia qirimensis]|uniref:class F sortase n=1 Tax=Mumia qirimensis TaxID=3234852 RepID=UPI00351D5572
MTTEPDLVAVRREARARRRARARVRTVVGVVAGAAGLLCLWVAYGASASFDGVGAGEIPAETRAPETAKSPLAPAPTRTLPAGRAALPVSVSVPELGVDAPVAPMSAVDGVLTPPPDASTVGWWDAGARPGAAKGTVVVAGHTVHTGGGAFDDLGTLDEGARVAVRTRRGVVRYEVRRVETYDRAALAAKSARLFRRTGTPRLLLITCEDWDGEGYRSNTVVVAAPVPAP